MKIVLPGDTCSWPCNLSDIRRLFRTSVSVEQFCSTFSRFLFVRLMGRIFASKFLSRRKFRWTTRRKSGIPWNLMNFINVKIIRQIARRKSFKWDKKIVVSFNSRLNKLFSSIMKSSTIPNIMKKFQIGYKLFWQFFMTLVSFCFQLSAMELGL